MSWMVMPIPPCLIPMNPIFPNHTVNSPGCQFILQKNAPAHKCTPTYKEKTQADGCMQPAGPRSAEEKGEAPGEETQPKNRVPMRIIRGRVPAKRMVDNSTLRAAYSGSMLSWMA